jgi:ferredoxin
MSTVRIAAHHERCIGAGSCVEVADKYFDQDDTTGTVVVLRETAELGDEALVEKAINVCPVSALYGES